VAAAKDRGYEILLMDAPVDSFIGFSDARWNCHLPLVDSDTIDKLIDKVKPCFKSRRTGKCS
jgi:hypothetical protein